MLKCKLNSHFNIFYCGSINAAWSEGEKNKREKPLLHTKADSPCDPPALENRSMLKHLEASRSLPGLWVIDIDIVGTRRNEMYKPGARVGATFVSKL